MGEVQPPDHPAVVIPTADVPPSVAVLSGAWEGTWSNGAKSVLVVYRLEKGKARLLHAFGEGDNLLAWHEWARPTVVPGDKPRLEWKNDWSSVAFELSPATGELSGELREFSRDGGGKTWRVVMRHRNIERVAPEKVKAPLVCPELARELRLIEEESDQKRRTLLVDALMGRAKQGGTPLTEPGATAGTTCATFIYRGEAREVGISGDMNGWSEQKELLFRLPGMDLFYYCGEYPADSRIEYNLVIDGTAGLDPFNPRVSLFNRKSNSEVPMPGYRPPPEVEPAPVAARGTVEEIAIVSKQPGMSRTATVYLPVGYAGSAERYPVLYLNDAFGALKFGSMINVLDNLIRRRVVPPLIAVLLPSVGDRMVEYSMNPRFESFVVEAVVPAVDRRYRTRPSPEFRAVGGISAGATAALSLAINHPDLFGKCMAQSTATKLAPLIKLARSGPKAPIRVYLDVGRFESDYHGKDLVEASHRIRDALVAHGCPVHLREVNEGHGWRNWRARMGEALEFLFASLSAMERGE
ncbi:alpha/beta hydrolase [Pelobacter propionicus]|nr:alpha/beta hydrolase-fold protein [Pelobacter propionicus]